MIYHPTGRAPLASLLDEENLTRSQHPSGLLWSAQRLGQSHYVLLGNKIQRTREIKYREFREIKYRELRESLRPGSTSCSAHCSLKLPQGSSQRRFSTSAGSRMRSRPAPGELPPSLQAPIAGSAAVPLEAQRHKHQHEHHGGGSANPLPSLTYSYDKGEDTHREHLQW